MILRPAGVVSGSATNHIPLGRPGTKMGGAQEDNEGEQTTNPCHNQPGGCDRRRRPACPSGRGASLRPSQPAKAGEPGARACTGRSETSSVGNEGVRKGKSRGVPDQ